MAKASKENKDGIDRWTSNGYGVFSGNNTNTDLKQERKDNKRDLNKEFRDYVNRKE